VTVKYVALQQQPEETNMSNQQNDKVLDNLRENVEELVETHGFQTVVAALYGLANDRARDHDLATAADSAVNHIEEIDAAIKKIADLNKDYGYHPAFYGNQDENEQQDRIDRARDMGAQ
jgi:PleD family two-component response regulator